MRYMDPTRKFRIKIDPYTSYQLWAAKTAKIQLFLTNQSTRQINQPSRTFNQPTGKINEPMYQLLNGVVKSIDHFTLPINQLPNLTNLPSN